MSAADLRKSGTIGTTHFQTEELHSVCSDASSEPRTIALMPNTTSRPMTAWQPQEHPCSGNPRNTLDRGCRHAHLSKEQEIVVIHIEQSDEFRGVFPKSSNDSLLEFDSRRVTRADLPYATIGAFHIHPSISHGAARDDFQTEIMLLVTLYQCDAITGDANNGLMNILMKAYQRLWNETENLPEWNMQWRLPAP